MRSKLEVHLDILRALARYGPLKLTHIMYKTATNCRNLKTCLEFLIKQNLVEERAAGKKRVAYVITERGVTALKHLRQLETALDSLHGSALKLCGSPLL